MGVPIKWQEELIAIAWINIAIVVMSLPLFSIYIVGSLEGENMENFMLHTQRGQHFVEVIVKYFASVIFWIPMSIILKIGASKASSVLIKTCSAGHLVFLFMLALQLIVEPPQSTLLVCAYGICFLYLTSSLWMMKNFVEELRDTRGDLTPALSTTLNSDTIISDDISTSDNFDELNDIADQRSVFRLQPLSKVTPAAAAAGIRVKL